MVGTIGTVSRTKPLLVDNSLCSENAVGTYVGTCMCIVHTAYASQFASVLFNPFSCVALINTSEAAALRCPKSKQTLHESE